MREFGDRGWRMREFGDEGAENETVETWRAERECRVQKGIKELHRSLDSAGNFGPGEEVPHLGIGAAHMRATYITGTSRTAALGRKRCVGLKAVRKGQVGQTGTTDFGPGVERFSKPCEIGK